MRNRFLLALTQAMVSVVALVAQRAGLEPLRVVEAVPSEKE